ncbi:MAG: Asd/ArgC dimerization domain-containing protein [Candidatus Korobacteraceae bacterium]
MKNDPKTPVSRPDAGARGDAFRLAIVGAATLKGRELKEVLAEHNFPAYDTRLLDDEESLGQVDSVGDEPTFIQTVMPEHLENVDFTFFTADDAYTRSSWQMARTAGSDIIDLSYALEGLEGVSLRAPWVERELGTTPSIDFGGAPVVVAHPAAMVLALLLLRIQKVNPVKSAVVTVFEPASEHGRRGMDELHEQTVNLLSFQQLPRSVFDVQVAFNLIDRLGEKSLPPLASVEERILRHFRAIVGDKVVVPSLMLLQAPIFHGHAFSVYIEMTNPMKLEQANEALAGSHVEITQGFEDAPSNVNAAGQEQIQVALRKDPGHSNGLWLWAASDNLRVGAVAAVECAEGLIGGRPRGKVQ